MQLDAHIPQIVSVIKQSSSIDYQRKNFHQSLQGALPLSNSGTHWNPYYFDDLTESPNYSSLKTEVETTNRASTGQDAFIINIVQRT